MDYSSKYGNFLNKGISLNVKKTSKLFTGIHHLKEHSRMDLELNGKQQLLLCVDDVNKLGEKSQTIRENTEIFIKASKDIDLEVNSEKTEYSITSHHQNLKQNQNTVIEI